MRSLCILQTTCCSVTKSCLTLLGPHGLTVAWQALLSVGFPRQAYWSGLPFPSPGDLPDPEVEPMSSALAGRLYHWATGEAPYYKCVCVCVCSVTQSCPTLCDLTDCSPPDSSIHWIFQARVRKWVAISYSKGSSWPRGWTYVFCIGRQILYHCATWEAHLTFWGTTKLFLLTLILKLPSLS